MPLAPVKSYRQPFGSDPLRREIARRVRYVRDRRGLTVEQAAKQLGLEQNVFMLLEKGRAALTSELCDRLLHWFSARKNYANVPYNPARKAKVGPGWRRIAFYAPPVLLQEMRNKADHLHLTLDELCQLAVESFVTNEAAIHVFHRAVEALQKTRVTQMLKAIPALQELLEYDLEIAVELGAKIDIDQLPAEAKTIKETPVAKLAQYMQENKQETLNTQQEADERLTEV